MRHQTPHYSAFNCFFLLNNITAYTPNSTKAKAIPTGYPMVAGSLNPSFAISMYVMLTADINAAGIAVRSELNRYAPFLMRYDVATHSAIIASV